MTKRLDMPVKMAMMAATILSSSVPVMAADKVSSPGQYSGYSSVLYDDVKMTSQYIPMRDGTKIAIDIFRPMQNGKVVDRKLPVVWMNSPYNRRGMGKDPTVRYYPGAALALVKYGYVVAVADIRGTFGSFGKALHSNRTEWAPWAFWDAYDVTEWLAAQDWSDSKIGMWGCSATGHSQWQAAATKAPHLRAIFPMSGPSEYYDWNGVTATTPPKPTPFPGEISKRELDGAAPVDADRDGSMLKAALEEHRYSVDYGFVPYRDSVSSEVEQRAGVKNFRPWLDVNTFEHFNDINASKIGVYETSNFGEDQRVKLGVLVKQRNVKNPLKLIMAPGNHCNWSSEYRQNPNNSFNAPVEELRWYDYWLKGIQNGILNEPPIYMYTYNRPAGADWQFAWQWPLPTQRNVNYYFSAGNDPSSPLRHGLDTAKPAVAGGKDTYTVDYSVAPETRDTKGITFTTTPFAADTTLTGSPIVHLWITSTATDGDFFGYMADVAPDGKVTPLPGTDDGQLRASMRALGQAPYDNLGLPYHRSFKADARPLVPGQPTELVFDMSPISWVFKAGHSFRLIVTGSARDHHGGPPVTPELNPAPVVSFLRDPAHASFIALPVNGAIDARLQLTSDANGPVARVTFPATLDPRYIADVKTGSVMLNGVAATSVHADGHSLVARFAPDARPKAGEAASVSGAFGQRYSYGDLARFTASTVQR